MFIGSNYKLSSGVGISEKKLPSFDKALLEAGVGNYNLVRLSSILPAECKEAETITLKEGSLLPVAYSTISSNIKGDFIISTIGMGIPEDSKNVGVIMEYSTKNDTVENALKTLHEMIEEAFEIRGWVIKEIKDTYACVKVEKDNAMYTTFACVAEW